MRENVFALVMAGGIGTRMGAQVPKQFLMLDGRPILAYTTARFAAEPVFDKVIVLIPSDWTEEAEKILTQYLPGEQRARIAVTAGGASRNYTLMNGIAYIEEHFGLDEETVIVTHDSVRPFVTHQMIMENIDCARRFGACGTAVPASSRVIRSGDGQTVDDIPDRHLFYQAQTPQSFRAMQLRTYYQSLTDAQKDVLTDACRIMAMKGVQVRIVEGSRDNFKITYPADLVRARALIKARKAAPAES